MSDESRRGTRSSRRSFLATSARAGGVGLGLGALGTTGYFATHQPHARTLPPGTPDDASRPLDCKTPRRVVVIGGGLAGLVTAIELAARKLDVTLVERAAHLGGKLSGWKIDVDGESFPMEHGFHGFFGQYYNLYEHLTASGAIDNLSPPPVYPVRFRDGAQDDYGEITKVFPLNMLSVVHQSSSMKQTDFMGDGPALLELMRWAGEKTYAKYDGVDFASFAKDGGINQPMRDRVLQPFGRTTLNRNEALSAAEGIRFFHFFFIGNPSGLWYRYTKRDAVSDVIEPLMRRLRSLGGKIRAGTAVRRLRVESGRVTGVELEGDEPGSAAQVRVDSSTVPTSGWGAIAGPDGSAVYVSRRDGGFVAFDARCTHMQCPVRPDAATGGFACPCHGGHYAADGAPTGGPPQRPLRSLPVVAEGNELLVGDAHPIVASGEIIPCDYAVSACEVRGTKALFAKSNVGVPELERRVAALGESDPYLVYRVWLDKEVRPDRTAFYTASGYRYLDSVAIYTKLQEPYIAWGKRTQRSVVELHAYGVAPKDVRPSEEMARSLFEELQQVLPELAGARITHGEYLEQSNFSRFAPGDHALRPRTETEIPNLFLAGDHVRMDPAVALMEAATMSGRFATNAILRKEGLREVPIRAVAERGPMA